MNFFRRILICLACFFWSGEVAKVNGFVVNFDSGAKFLFVTNHPFGQLMEAVSPPRSVSPIFGNSCFPQIFDSIVRFIPINVVEYFLTRNGSIVHDPYKPVKKEANFVKTNFEVSVTPNTSRNTSRWTPPSKGSLSLRAWKMTPWAIFPKQPSIPVFKTLPKVFLAGNFLDALVIGGYTFASGNIHVVDDVVVRSC